MTREHVNTVGQSAGAIICKVWNGSEIHHGILFYAGQRKSPPFSDQYCKTSK